MTKTPLILLPGLLCDEALWAHQSETLSDIADITVADMTRDETSQGMTERVLDSAPETFALAGLSMGGYAAQEIIRRAPERVERLALLDTSARADSPEYTKQRKGFIEQLELGDFRGVTSRLLPLLVHEDRLSDDGLIAVIQTIGRKRRAGGLYRPAKGDHDPPRQAPGPEKITCPALVLCGRQDALTPLALHEEMAGAIAGASLVVIEDCGHLSPLERPRAVSAVMRYWLAR